LPGQSGNVYGKPKKRDQEELKVLEAACPAAARKLVELMDADDQRVALSAARAVLERVYGKPEAMKATMKKTEGARPREVVISWAGAETKSA
jgi:hypothetical protein